MRNMLTKYSPDARLLERLRHRMDHLFEDFAADFPLLRGNGFFPDSDTLPALNLWEDESNLYAECEIPGVRMEDLDLAVVGNKLHLKGEWKHERVENATYHREERTSGSFSRVVELPVEIDSDKVSASLKDGILTVALPKSAAARSRKVEVKAIEK